ncbi:MAG: hypothetical protein JRH01_01940 [Deltaproteobacteria bacterium]|nr:hypothetical protein [Deltaproteobacteria bacterium]MBW2394825.1 hypothetical protein [Deltaproteobacteria bacterium]
MPDPAVASDRFHRWLPNLALAAVSVALTLGLFEVGARLFVRAWAPEQGVQSFWSQHPLLGWAHVPSAQGRHIHRDFEVSVATNAQGFRDDPVTLERTAGRRRVLFLGDSFGFGYGVERGELLPDLLEGRFPDTEFVNTSVAGYGTDQQLLFFREEGHRYAPDLVLYLFHPNDVEDNNANRRYRYPKPHFVFDAEGALQLRGVPVPSSNLREKFSRFLRQRTYVLHRVWEWRSHLRNVWRAWRAQPEPPAEAPARAARNSPAASASPTREWIEFDGPTRPPKPGRNHDFRTSRALIETLDAETKRHDAQLAIISIGGAPDPRELLTATLRRIGVPYLPLDAAFAKNKGHRLKFQHDPHWNPAGHVLAADTVERWLRDEGLL